VRIPPLLPARRGGAFSFVGIKPRFVGIRPAIIGSMNVIIACNVGSLPGLLIKIVFMVKVI